MVEWPDVLGSEDFGFKCLEVEISDTQELSPQLLNPTELPPPHAPIAHNATQADAATTNPGLDDEIREILLVAKHDYWTHALGALAPDSERAPFYPTLR